MIKFIKYLFILYIFCATTKNVLAQNSFNLIVMGEVMDEKGIPITDVKVQDAVSKKATVTDDKGLFKMTLAKKKIQLQFFHLGYENLEKNIASQEDTVFVKVVLTKKTEQLSTIEISSEQIHLVYDKPNASILDYEFYEDKILLLLTEGGKDKLRLIDENSNSITELRVRNNPEKLFRDCFNNILLVYADSAYQIYYDKEKIALDKAIDILDFNNILVPCVAHVEGNYFFRMYGPHNLSILYYMLASESKQRKIIRNVFDLETSAYADAFLANLGMDLSTAPHTMGNNNSVQQTTARDAEEKEAFYETIISKPTYSPLFEINKNVFVFDHLADSVFVFNKQGAISRKFGVEYPKKKGWKNELIVDNVTQQVYAKFIKDGLTYLQQISLENGSALNEFKLEKHTYIHAIKIKNGVVYYLYRGKGDMDLMYLYYQKL